MKKIALVSLPYLPFYMRNARCDFVSLSGTQWYPIWLGFLGAFLEKKGYEIEFIDAPAAGLEMLQVSKILTSFKPDLLVVYTGRLSEESDISKTDFLVKKLHTQAIFVGPYFSINPRQTLKKSKQVSVGVMGEFEYPILEFLKGRSVSKIKNLIYKKGSRIMVNPIRPNLTGKQLDEIPFVSKFFAEHLNLRNYKTPSEYYPFIDIMTGRGCVWGKCSYCLWVQTFIKGSRYSVRSIANLVEELKYICQNLPQVKSVMIQDDTFPDARAREFSQALIKNKIKILWSCYARANLSYKTMTLMKKAGCLNLHVGFESACDKILKNIDKGLNKKTMEKFALDARKAGVAIHGDFALGFPGESRQSLRATIDWAKKLKPDTAQFQLMIPFHGTKFYNDLKKAGNLKNNEPNFKNLSASEVRAAAKQAYREFYFSWHYIKRILRHPVQHFILRFDTYIRAIPAMFWSRWIK